MRYQTKGSRRLLVLGNKVGEGGEGAIYLIADDPAIVLKLYRKPVFGKKFEKLKALIKIDTPSLRGVTAWPIDLVVNRRGETCGFVMNRVVGSLDVHELYSPKSRTSSFPEADFRFVCHVATNLARAFAEVHKSGVVIGDVNQGSVLVSAKGTIALIDCDSFQIRDSSNLFTCDVGVPLFTPPELQGRPFRGMIRQENHDLFGLAVLLFHLLYLGRHPYAGVFSGSGESQIGRASCRERVCSVV